MHATAALLVALFPYALAIPPAMPPKPPHRLLPCGLNPKLNWTTDTNSTIPCSSTPSKTADPTNPKLDAVLNNACAALMPACAYPARLGPDTFCVMTIDFALPREKSTVQMIDGGALRFSVKPVQANNTTSAGVFWTKADCYGNFAQIVPGIEPTEDQISGVARLTVGETGSLFGTVFQVQYVEGVQIVSPL